MKRGLDPKTGYSRYAKEYDVLKKHWDSFEQDYLKPYIKLAKDKKVLDAGCGTGRLSIKLHKSGANVTALDISPDMLAILNQKQSGIETIEGDMEHMPFEDNSFDMVFSTLAMVHLKKIDTFLDECYRIMKDDGKFILVNIHFRKPMVLKDLDGKYTIQCYNHFPKHVLKAVHELAFGVEEEIIVTEGDDVWVSQILVLTK